MLSEVISIASAPRAAAIAGDPVIRAQAPAALLVAKLELLEAEQMMARQEIRRLEAANRAMTARD